jgi:hypothetical protein
VTSRTQIPVRIQAHTPRAVQTDRSIRKTSDTRTPFPGTLVVSSSEFQNSPIGPLNFEALPYRIRDCTRLKPGRELTRYLKRHGSRYMKESKECVKEVSHNGNQKHQKEDKIHCSVIKSPRTFDIQKAFSWPSIFIDGRNSGGCPNGLRRPLPVGSAAH